MTLVESLTCRRPKFVDVEILARLISDQKMSARWRESYQTNMLEEWWANLAYLFEFSLQVKSMNPDLHQVFCGNRAFKSLETLEKLCDLVAQRNFT